jgi:outer membrane lipoprotein carrier protein
MKMLMLAALAILQAPPAPPAPKESPKDVLEKMQKFYERTQDFKAEFRQTRTEKAFERKQIFDGTVRFKKPGKMRWDYRTPEKKLFVSDGKTLWLYEPEDNQAFKQSLSESALPVAVTFLFGQGKLTKEFEVSAATDTGDAVDPADVSVKLSPKAPTAQYKFIVLEIDPKDFHVKQSFVHDTQGNINQVTFSKVELNTKQADSLFSWSPPPGTKIIKPGDIR